MSDKKTHINIFKPILLKEWIKTRLVFIISLIICVASISNIFLNINHDISSSNLLNYWYNIIFLDFNHIVFIKYIPAIIGLSIATSQYLPEITDKRIKLSLHLPVSENKIILNMHIIGTLFLIIIFSILVTYLLILSSLFFPAEITQLAIISMYPWILAGFSIYFLSALVIFEPNWIYRIIYILISYFILSIYFENNVMGAFYHINIKLTILTLACGITVLFSSYRLRKGEI